MDKPFLTLSSFVEILVLLSISFGFVLGCWVPFFKEGFVNSPLPLKILLMYVFVKALRSTSAWAISCVEEYASHEEKVSKKESNDVS